jgi:hypothetical protein
MARLFQSFFFTFRVFACVVVMTAALGGSALAANLNVAVTSNSNGVVAVEPGASVAYEVRGTLSDTSNRGLSLVLFDLTFTGGVLPPANEPTRNPMLNFARPAGITNPAGFGGTQAGGGLVQVGGAQNTIGNTLANAPFPIGTVIVDVAHAETILATGSLTAPLTPGVYQLTLSNLRAGVIQQGETGAGGFWATEPAGAGVVNHLTIEVIGLPVSVSGEGPRYLAVVPPPGAAPVALLVTGDPLNPAVSCLSAYVQADGALDAAPLFQTPAQWGTAHVGDSEILPDTTYRVQADYNAPGGTDVTAPVAATTWLWGDVDHSVVVNLDDLLCELDGFGGNFSACSLYALDLMGLVPNRLIDLDDILAALNAFGSAAYPGMNPCP